MIFIVISDVHFKTEIGLINLRGIGINKFMIWKTYFKSDVVGWIT